MKTIIPSFNTISSIYGIQTPKKGEHYRCSVYCVSVPCEDGTLLYHTLTGELVLLSSSEGDTDREQLIGHWFMVPEAYDEKAEADRLQVIAGLIGKKQPNKTNFTILTTTDCNARCSYCYEIGIKRTPMSMEMADRVADYIVTSCGGKSVKLRWFGGEPLYNQQVIDIICNHLRDSEIQFESSMISNGFYLERETSRHAVEKWNLRKIQITVDGTEHVYNRIKAYIDADGNPYLRVMDNIRDALDAGIRVTVRMNMDERNAENLLQLADDIAERFHDYKNFQAYVALIHDFSGKMHIQETAEDCKASFERIRVKLAEHGILLRIKLPRAMRTARCIADDDACEVILPDGRVGRCEHYSDSMITGSIFDNIRDPKVEKEWKIPLSVPECSQCVLYPACNNLKMCEWNRTGCLNLQREILINELKEQIVEAYNTYRAEE